MNRQKLTLFLINLLGGAAVIGSYVWGVLVHPGQTDALWGGVPASIRSIISINMLLAAAGYIAIFLLLMLRIPSMSSIGKFPFTVFHIIYLFILIPSALWMPLTYAVIESYSLALWLAVILVLALTAIAGIALLLALLSLHPPLPPHLRWLAVVGAAFFILQTGVLDAIFWTAFFFH